MTSQPFQPGSPGPTSDGGRLQALDVEPQLEAQRETAERVVSRVSPGQRSRQRIFSTAEEEEPQLFVVSRTLSRSPVLQDAQRALLNEFEGEAFDFLEGVNTILNNTMIPERRAVDVLDRLVRFGHVVRLEET